MNLRDSNRQTARIDSRRFARGVPCIIIHDQITLQIMSEAGLIPAGIKLTAGPSGAAYFDPIVGKFFALFKTSEQAYKDYLHRLNKNLTPLLDKSNIDNYTIENLKVMQLYKQPFIDFLKQSIVFVTIPASRLIEGRIPDPETYDILVETEDLTQTTDCIFINKSINVPFRTLERIDSK